MPDTNEISVEELKAKLDRKDDFLRRGLKVGRNEQQASGCGKCRMSQYGSQFQHCHLPRLEWLSNLASPVVLGWAGPPRLECSTAAACHFGATPISRMSGTLFLQVPLY